MEAIIGLVIIFIIIFVIYFVAETDYNSEKPNNSHQFKAYEKNTLENTEHYPSEAKKDYSYYQNHICPKKIKKVLAN